MRIEDWQDWIEKQFLDTNPPPDTREAPEPELPAADASASPILDESQARGETSPAATTVVARSPVMSSSRAVPPAHTEPAGTDSVDEVPIPEINRYFSFLQPREEAAAPEPARTTLFEPEVPAESMPHGAAGEAEAAEPTFPPLQPSAPIVSQPVEPDPEPVVHSEPATLQPEPAPAEVQPTRTAARPHRQRTRARSMRTTPPPELAPPLTSEDFWRLAPRHVRTLIAMGQDDTVQNSYKRQFKESRLALIERILDPTLSLEETARLLNVCPTTVRRYTNKGLLRHQRTQGDQRRFKLSDVLSFMESRTPSSEA